MAIESFWDFGNVIQSSFINLWETFIVMFPGVVAAIVVIILGWVVGKLAGGMLRRVLDKAKIDHWIDKNRLSEALYGRQLSSILGSLLKWYIIVIFLSAAASLVELEFLSTVMASIVLYLPALIGAGVLVLGGMLVGEYIRMIVKDTKIMHKEYVGEGLKWLIVYFAVVIGLQTAGFEVAILIDAFRIGFTALAVTVAIIAGIGFGLAFREDIEKVAKELKKSPKKK